MKRIQTGFTLMELIGVMAVLAILSAAMAPSIFDAIDDAYSEAEERNLEALAANLETYLLSTRSLPSDARASWTAALASVSDEPIQRILLNRRNFRRTLYFDPRFFTSADSNFGSYTQTVGLSGAPVSPRVMLISDMSRNSTRPAMNSAVFNDIWNQDPGASLLESDDVKIVRLNLSAHFLQVVMSNAQTSQVSYSLDAGSRSAIAANNGVTDGILERHVIAGTSLRLYQDPFPTGALATATLISTAKGFRYITNGTAWFWEST